MSFSPTAPSGEEFDQAVNHDTDPKINEQPKIEAIGLMAARWRQVRHQEKEIDQVAEYDGGELLEEAREHATCFTRRELGDAGKCVGYQPSAVSMPKAPSVGDGVPLGLFP